MGLLSVSGSNHTSIVLPKASDINTSITSELEEISPVMYGIDVEAIVPRADEIPIPCPRICVGNT